MGGACLGTLLVLAWPWVFEGQRFLGVLAEPIWLLLAAAWSVAAVLAWRASRGWGHGVLALVSSGGAASFLALFLLARDGLGMAGGTPRHAAPCQDVPLASGAREWTARDGHGGVVRGVLHASRSSLGLVVLPSWPSGARGLAIDTLARWWAPRARVLVLYPAGAPGVPGVQGPDGRDARGVLEAAAWLRRRGASRIVGLGEGDGALAMARAALVPGTLDAVVLAGPAGRWGEARGGDAWWRGLASLPGRLAWAAVTGWRLAAPGPGDGETLVSLVPRIAPLPLLLLGGGAERDPVLTQAHDLAGEPRSLRWLPGRGRPVPWDGYEAYHQTVMDWLALTFPVSGAGVSVPQGRSVPPADIVAQAPGAVVDMRRSVLPTASPRSAPGRLMPGREALDLVRIFDDPQPILPPMATHPPVKAGDRLLPPAAAADPVRLPSRPHDGRVTTPLRAIPAPPRVPFRWPTLEPIEPPAAGGWPRPNPTPTAIIEWEETRQEGTATGSLSR